MCVVIDQSACTQLTKLPSNVKEQTLHCTMCMWYYTMEWRGWMDG